VTTASHVGPDLVIAGAARSGTSLLAAHLSAHPAVDGGAVKEPNFFSKNFDRGPDWYDSYYRPRSERPVRLDASVSYTYPQYGDALPRLAAAAAGATVVYVVRDPAARAVSHYLLNRYYFGHESAPDFGTALRERSFYVDVSDYGLWIDRLLGHFPDERVVVVPFDAVKASAEQVAGHLCARIGLAPPPRDGQAIAHQNNVVTFRSETFRRVTRTVRHSRAYPVVRRTLSPHVLRRIRSALTRVPEMPSVDEALATCSPEQLELLAALNDRAGAAVTQRLRDQDARLGVEWAPLWRSRPVDAILAASGQPLPTAGRLGDEPADGGQRH
jgi:hypothetical protein